MSLINNGGIHMVKKLIEKLYVDKDNHEYLMDNYIEGGRFRLFSNTFFGKLGAMSRTNWVMLLFCLPAFAVLFYTYYLSLRYAAYTPFSGNLGIGYPVVPDADAIYAGLMFKNNMFRALLLVPCIIVGFVGLAGAFNVIKYESLGIDVKIFKTFFKGIRNNAVIHLWLGLINSVIVFLLLFAINDFGVENLHIAVKIVSIVLLTLLLAFSVVMSMYIMTQAALYDLPLSKMIKNAVRLTFSFILQNFIILVFSAVPVGLLFLMGTSYLLQLLVIMALAMVGFSYIICVWTIYNHYVYSMLFSAVIESQGGNKKKKKRAHAQNQTIQNKQVMNMPADKGKKKGK